MNAWSLTAKEALAKVRAKELTIQQYARSLLSRIEQRDDAVRAWAYLDPKYVLEQAKALDEVPFDKRGPLHGLPVAVKDIMHTKDMPTQYNSPIYINNNARVDAGSVMILRDAGCLIFGKTTTTEFAVTTVGPKTRNAHDPSRTPGGSSSGSSAAVADFQIPVGLGSQTAGSIIRPASFNGIYGFKPTWNAITREGQKVASLVLDTIGFFTRSTDDIELLADAFAVEDDEGSSFRNIQGAKFAVCKTMVWDQAGEGTRAALPKAVELLKAHGAEVEEITLGPDFDRLPEWHRTVMFREAGTQHLPEYRHAKEKLDQSLVGFVENQHKITRKAELEAYDGIAALRPRIDAIAGRYDAVLVPSVPDEAPLGLEYTGNAVFCAPWTALHTPVLNIPGFRGPNNMPVGLSLVAPRFRDRHLLKVGKAVGQVFEAAGDNNVSSKE